MKLFFTISCFIFFLPFLFSQTPEDIRNEAYPTSQQVQVNQFSQSWENLVNAKTKGAEFLHQYYLDVIKNRYQGSLTYRSEPYTLYADPKCDPVTVTNIYSGSIYSGGTNTESGGNPKTIRVRTDSLGNQYVAFINGSRDSLIIYKSTNNGSGWTRIQSITMSAGAVWQGFDFCITDTTNAIRLCFAASAVTSSSSLDGTIYFFVMNSDGTSFRYNVVESPTGRGFISPNITTDGYNYSPALTYFYICYQDFSTTTPTVNPTKAAISPDWGGTWTSSFIRTGYNDYDGDIEVKHFDTGDSVYVVHTNNLTASNPNLRIRKASLPTVTTWGQYNVAGSSSPEKHCSITSSKLTGDMAVAYTIVSGGNDNIAYSYTNTSTGSYFSSVPSYIASNSYNENKAVIDCNENDGIFRAIYTAEPGTYDTVIYKSTTDLSSGFNNVSVINPSNNASSVTFPAVTGAKYNDNLEGLSVFTGEGLSGVYYSAVTDSILPVELISFNASSSCNNILVRWATASEINNRGFEVEIKTQGSWKSIIFITGAGTTTEEQKYSYVVQNCSPGTYYIRLRQIDFDGSITYSNVVYTEIVGKLNFELSQNYPNPFNPSTVINYSIKEKGLVKIKLYDILGKEISVLLNEIKEPGIYSLSFNGSNIPSGVYFYSMNVNGYSFSKKMMLTK